MRSRSALKLHCFISLNLHLYMGGHHHLTFCLYPIAWEMTTYATNYSTLLDQYLSTFMFLIEIL